MVQTTIWLSYDLGVSGDYEGLYAWLENQGAKECGSSVAYVKDYQFSGDLLESLEADVSNAVTLNQRSRIYVIFKADDGRMRGHYVVGRRKAPPWTGFGDDPENVFDDD